MIIMITSSIGLSSSHYIKECPLSIAIKQNSPDIITYLVKHGAVKTNHNKCYI